MNHENSSLTSSLWGNLVRSHLSGNAKKFAETLSRFLTEDVDRVSILKQALRGKDRDTAVSTLAYLPIADLQQLFDELVFLSSFSHGSLQVVRDAILSLPREWVLEHLKSVVEPILAHGTYDEYRRMLELYSRLDRAMTRELARRAAANSDQDIREAGEDFLKWIGE